MKNFSCSYSRLYANGGFYEGTETAEQLVDIGDECRFVAEVLPSYAYERPQPAHLLCRDAAFETELLGTCQDWNATYSRGSPAELYALENGLLFNRCLYKAFGGAIVQMYETNKPNDRPWRPDLDPGRDLQTIKQAKNAEAEFFYLGSIGSENYGHWLVDDLTRAKALLTHFPRDRMPTIVLNGYFPLIDGVREQSLRALTAGIADIDVIFLEYRSAYFFPRLYFVSPSSYHPFLKSPQGAAFLRDHLVGQAAGAPSITGRAPESGASTHLFVTRRALWRNVINLDAVVAYFRCRGFEIVELEGLSFIDQVRVFSCAEIVVGVMGAGMTNVVFSPEGATVVHLAPEGWKDPFFWDLAAVKKHRYGVAFGEPWAPHRPSFTPFTINLAQLDAVCGWF